MERALVVGGERPISGTVKLNLAKEDYDIYTAYGGEETLEKVAEVEPDSILPGLMLSKVDGLEVAYEVHKTYDISIITVTAGDSEIDKVLGLGLGADDYVIKPFSNRELVACVKANPHRGATAAEEPEEVAPAELMIGGLTIHSEACVMTKQGRTIELTRREFELLFYLAKHLEQVMTREHLLQTIWGYDYFGDIRTADVTVRRLREEIEDSPSHPNYLVTRYSVGYYSYNPEQE